MKYIFLTVLVFFWLSLQAHSFELKNFSESGINYQWEQSPDPVAFKRIVTESVYDCYRQIPRSILQIDSNVDIKSWIAQSWGEILESLKIPENNLHLLTAKKESTPVGYAVFDMSCYPEFIYISELAVDPFFQRQGIAKRLVHSIRKQLPDMQKYVAITRRANFQACGFYKALGFKESNYMREGYDRTLFIGLELDLRNMPCIL